MNTFKYVYKNCGRMKLGYDISKIEVELNRNNFEGDLTIEMSTGKIEIKDKMYNILNKENKIMVNEVLDKLEKVKLPKETNFDFGGCDGFAWEMGFDDEKHQGYIFEPDFCKEVLKIIEFDKIYDYCNNKLDKYLD